MKVLRARAEAFGAIVSTDEPPALLYVDRPMARRIGVEGGAVWEVRDQGLTLPVLSAPTEVHVAVTDRCPAGCTGCYADARAEGHEPSFAELCARLESLARLGAFRVAFGGGEPGLRPDVGALAERARELGLVPTMTTSGLGITRRSAEALRPFAQVNVSLDGAGDAYRAVRGWDGAAVAESAVEHLIAAGIAVGVNALLTRSSLPHVEELAARVERLGAVELQLLRFKPSGRGRLDYLAQRLSAEQIRAIPALLRRLSEERELAIRIDCAMVPFLAADPAITVRDLSRFGVAGCEAGRSLMTVDARGGVHPCSFHREPADSSLGDAHASWSSDVHLTAFRDHAAEPPEPCASCPVRAVCRGGCRIVATHADGPRAPDPECPRVRASRVPVP